MNDIDLRLVTVADMRRPGALSSVGRAFDLVKELAPERIGLADPLRPRDTVAAKSIEAAMAAFEQRLPADKALWLFFKRLEKQAPGGDGFLRVRDPGPSLADGHDLILGYRAVWFHAGHNWPLFARLFRDLASAMDAYYGKASLADQQPTGVDFERELVDVAWLNYFGPSFLQFWKDRLIGLGVRQIKTNNGGVVVWASDEPWVGSAPPEIYRPFLERLDANTFVRHRARRGEPGEFVPPFSVHQHYAAGGDQWLRGRPVR